MASRVDEPAETPFRLAGPLCDGGDVYVGDDDTPYRAFPAATAPGDVVAFLDAGAYGLEQMHPYNARPRAAAYAVDRGELSQIRSADTVDDMIAPDLAPAAVPLAGDAVAKGSSRGAGRRRARR